MALRDRSHDRPQLGADTIGADNPRSDSASPPLRVPCLVSGHVTRWPPDAQALIKDYVQQVPAGPMAIEPRKPMQPPTLIAVACDCFVEYGTPTLVPTFTHTLILLIASAFGHSEQTHTFSWHGPIAHYGCTGSATQMYTKT
jgi:hypothetical protein